MATAMTTVIAIRITTGRIYFIDYNTCTTTSPHEMIRTLSYPSPLMRKFTQSISKPDVSPDQVTQGAILMARLLQFNMAFCSVWTPKARSLSEDLCKSIFNLALVSTKHVEWYDCRLQ